MGRIKFAAATVATIATAIIGYALITYMMRARGYFAAGSEYAAILLAWVAIYDATGRAICAALNEADKRRRRQAIIQRMRREQPWDDAQKAA